MKAKAHKAASDLALRISEHRTANFAAAHANKAERERASPTPTHKARRAAACTGTGSGGRGDCAPSSTETREGVGRRAFALVECQQPRAPQRLRPEMLLHSASE